MLDSLDRTISLAAPAKINLALHVTGRRSDGYHLLDSLVIFAAFGDKVNVKHAPADSFAMSGPFGSELPDDENNLVLRARDALRRHFPEQATPVAIHLEKRLPVASGIGGGSSDAAATVRSLAALWGIEAEPEQLAAIGLMLGADVPMCLQGRSLIARGIGEDIEHVAGLPHLPILLANNGLSVSTPQVFAALEKRDNPPLPALPALATVLDVCAYLAETDNHLFAAAARLTPAICETMDELRNTDARLVRMSGSGGTCFAIYDSDGEAETAAKNLRQRNPDWFVVATHSVKEGS
ncbi:4-(cytidine 5'-diphospho)-2-C-methyl-D-erythritol kinase [Phyllobacterium brassicacearum]|uniref:4-diphosphocytidyl-2-C-methyl-D-erythritol kinase n=1 Tax=Phyllobacterium brassicacearum TaxID=314235 RepID=A0A2P7BW74_9HYPH|nr:4-(cytidine 5'-diphospho)-2-C-methyl-D-erythritol kinase [Phyllobacterium brassicacearum]PSH70708.1 4-(cytidine 5'-diphospho)-2-C-methyl-D-erythritol kinase [Phyllobacterium brassicacearum]TDQ35815.1 4-diphosphocytidyl-2-C-methyl-D-erythritol kinase [Phyllobacterium brassicacearum]